MWSLNTWVLDIFLKCNKKDKKLGQKPPGVIRCDIIAYPKTLNNSPDPETTMMTHVMLISHNRLPGEHLPMADEVIVQSTNKIVFLC